jgi:maltose alpha-D-glucosyltransferase / alpha-amylase
MLDDIWYKNAIIYCLDVETYVDSNGDGVGDFEGLTRRLDYLAGIGVTCLWLQPFYPSPNKDNGYDVSDYYGVHPKHGTLGDFVEFMNHAEQLGMRVIVDLVANHTSNRHPWFLQARKDPQSKYRDWYVWSKTRPADHDEGDGLPRRPEDDLDAGSRGRRVLLPSLLRLPARSEHTQSRVPAGADARHGLLAAARVAGFRMDAVPFFLEYKGVGAKPGRTTSCCTRCGSSCSGAAATRSCSPKRTCCRTRA